MSTLALLLLSASLSSAQAAQPRTVVSIGRDATIEAGQEAKEVVVIGGSAKIAGPVRDSVVVVGGSLELDAPVGRDVVVVFGSSKLGPAARVGGDAVAVGGRLEADPAATVRGDRQEVSFGALGGRLAAGSAWLSEWVGEGLFKLRLIPHGAAWAWAAAGLMLLGYVLVSAAAAGPVGAAVGVLEAQPSTAFLAGLLLCCLAGPLSLLLLVSVVGIVFLPFLLGAGLAGTVLGKTAVYQLAGTRLGLSGPRAALAGAALMLPLLAVPVLALPLWLLVTAWGLGAAALASAELVRREMISPPAAPMKTAAPEAPQPAPHSAPFRTEAESDAMNLPRASFGLRLGAMAIDVIAVAVIALITPVLTFGVFAWSAYQIALWTWKGTTFGGIVCGIRGVRVDGRPMDLTVAAVRHLASWFSALPGFLGFFWAGWDPEGRTWHDKIAGTVVVRAAKPESLV
ncbi:MAG: RDD family protein [Elusimicrobia bacterium]|nr:RDD family protein [Elusimicrobiota bacterium]